MGRGVGRGTLRGAVYDRVSMRTSRRQGWGLRKTYLEEIHLVGRVRPRVAGEAG